MLLAYPLLISNVYLFVKDVLFNLICTVIKLKDFIENAKICILCLKHCQCFLLSGLLNVKLSNGDYLVKGHNITSFTNDEENAVALMDAMPFALQTKLEEHGANFIAAGLFAENVQASERVITGQNPASATGTAEAVVKKLNE